MYGLALRHGAGVSCEDAAVKELIDLLKLVRTSADDQELFGPHGKPENLAPWHAAAGKGLPLQSASCRHDTLS